jgi:hypothetical protein
MMGILTSNLDVVSSYGEHVYLCDWETLTCITNSVLPHAKVAADCDCVTADIALVKDIR